MKSSLQYSTVRFMDSPRTVVDGTPELFVEPGAHETVSVSEASDFISEVSVD